jgi:hypothetical protein
MISEITRKDFLQASELQRLNVSMVPNYYYKLEVGSKTYFYASNVDLSKHYFQEFKSQSIFFLIYESFCYSFKTSTGEVIESLIIEDYYLDCTTGKRYIYVICELIVYKISIVSGLINDKIYAKDVILGFEIINEKIVLDIFEKEKMEIDLD